MAKQHFIKPINEIKIFDHFPNTQEFLCYSDKFEELVGLPIIRLSFVDSKTSYAGIFVLNSKLWLAETHDEFVYIVATNGVLMVGIGASEIAANLNIKRVGIFRYYESLTIDEIFKTLRWSMPKDYLEF